MGPTSYQIITSIFMGELHPKQNLSMFVHYLKIINTLCW